MSGDSTSPNIMYLRTHAAYLWILSLEQTSALSAGSHSHASLGALFWSVACLVVAFSCCWTELGTWLLHDSWLLWWLGHKSLRLGLEAPVLCLPVSSACAKKNLQHLSPMIWYWILAHSDVHRHHTMFSLGPSRSCLSWQASLWGNEAMTGIESPGYHDNPTVTATAK